MPNCTLDGPFHTDVSRSDYTKDVTFYLKSADGRTIGLGYSVPSWAVARDEPVLQAILDSIEWTP